MSRRYDSRTTIFSPEGRLYQVEYAMEAISHAGTAIGILAKDGVVLAAERKITSKLLDQDTSAEKMHAISKNIVCAVAGLDSDASRLVNNARDIAQGHLRDYDEEMPVSMLVTKLSNIKQAYTQFGGLRPYGVSFIYAGWDEISGYQLYQSNPSGNYSGWLATSVGANTAATQTLLKQHYQNDLSLKEACELALRVLSKTMDSTTLTSERIEFSTIGGSADGQPVRKVWLATEIDDLIANTDLTKKDE